MINKEMFETTYGLFEKEVVVEILDIFLSEYEARFDEMDKNLAEGDLELLGANAHGLKGSIAQLFAEETQALAQEVENMGRDKRSNGLQEAYTALKQSCEQLVETVQEYKETYQAV